MKHPTEGITNHLEVSSTSITAEQITGVWKECQQVRAKSFVNELSELMISTSC